MENGFWKPRGVTLRLSYPLIRGYPPITGYPPIRGYPPIKGYPPITLVRNLENGF